MVRAQGSASFTPFRPKKDAMKRATTWYRRLPCVVEKTSSPGQPAYGVSRRMARTKAVQVAPVAQIVSQPSFLFWTRFRKEAQVPSSASRRRPVNQQAAAQQDVKVQKAEEEVRVRLYMNGEMGRDLHAPLGRLAGQWSDDATAAAVADVLDWRRWSSPATRSASRGTVFLFSGVKG